MSALKRPVAYFNKEDFTLDGNLVPELRDRPKFVMIQANGCYHCIQAKPHFQQLANELAKEQKQIDCLTIVADGDTYDDRYIARKIPKIYKNIQGYPSFLLFINGKRIPYTGERTVEAFKKFLKAAIETHG